MNATILSKNIKSKWNFEVTFFTLLYIEYTLRGIDVETYLILPDYEACQIAIRDNEDMHKYFYADSDVNMYCVRTDTLSRSIKPMLRPTTDKSS